MPIRAEDIRRLMKKLRGKTRDAMSLREWVEGGAIPEYDPQKAAGRTMPDHFLYGRWSFDWRDQPTWWKRWLVRLRLREPRPQWQPGLLAPYSERFRAERGWESVDPLFYIPGWERAYWWHLEPADRWGVEATSDERWPPHDQRILVTVEFAWELLADQNGREYARQAFDHRAVGMAREAGYTGPTPADGRTRVDHG